MFSSFTVDNLVERLALQSEWFSLARNYFYRQIYRGVTFF